MIQARTRQRPSLTDPVLWLIMTLAALLLFYNLDQRPLWQDEAETACLARNVLKYGLPQAFDGKNLISQEEGREFTPPDYLWRWSPWLQIYLSAAGLILGGGTTAGVRFPFALIGLLDVLMVYLLVKKRFHDVAWARVSSSILALSVPFLLFARQGRYYSVGALLVLLGMYAFRGEWQKRLWPALLLILSLALLFYTNYLLLLSYAPPLAVAAVVMYRREIPWGRTLAMALMAVLLIVPGVLISRIGQQSGLMELAKFREHLRDYVTQLCQFMLPLPVVVYLVGRWIVIWRKKGWQEVGPEERFVLFSILIISGNIIILALVPQCCHRYMLHLYPFVAIILGWVVVRTWRYHRYSGAILFILLALTNVAHIVPLELLGKNERFYDQDYRRLNFPNIPLSLFCRGLASDYPDVNATVIDYLRPRVRPEETVMVNYGDLPLQFYIDAQVLGSLQNRVPPPDHLPDWVVMRQFMGKSRTGQVYLSEYYLREYLDLETHYEAITLEGPSERFGNRPDPYYYCFLPPLEPYQRLVVYRRKSG